MIACEIFLQRRDGVQGRYSSIQPSAVIAALGTSPATISTTSRAPGRRGCRRGALVAAPWRGGFVKIIRQVRQLVKSSISVCERRGVGTGRRPPLLLMLAVVMLEVRVMRVVLGERPDLRGEAASKARADMMGEILKQQSTVISRSGWDPPLVKETGVFVDDCGGGRCDGC